MSRVAFVLVALFGLSGCDAEAIAGFSLAAVPAGASVAKRAAAPTRTVLVPDRINIEAPTGYCIDTKSLRAGRAGGAFALIAACEALSKDNSGPSVDAAVMTIQVQPRGIKREQPTAAELAAAYAPAKVLSQINGDGISLIRISSKTHLIANSDDTGWRAVMVINGHLVGLALYPPRGSDLAGRNGKRLILQLAEKLRTASPFKTYQPASKTQTSSATKKNPA